MFVGKRLRRMRRFPSVSSRSRECHSVRTYVYYIRKTISQNIKRQKYTVRLYSESDPVKALITTRAVDTSPMYLTVSDAKKLPENDPCHRDGKEAIHARPK